MRKFVRVNALASAVCLALVGAVMQPSMQAQAAPLTATQQAVGAQSYIITFVEAGLLYYQGGVQGLAATAAASGAKSRKLDVRTPAAVAYDSFLESARSTHIDTIQSALGRSLSINHSYSVTLNGIAADVTADEAAAIARLPGVKSIRPAGVQTLTTFRGPKFIGADKIWDGTATPGNIGTRGEGIIVGDLDGGTNSDHPSFANDETCGFSSAAPKLVAVDCSTNTGAHCNGPNPEANPGFGHGVHTSSTAAGNTIDNTATPAPALPDGISMSGVAPCAAIHQYKVCATNNCDGGDILAGIQNAIADQVDVVNFSISGGTDPWNDNDRDFLDMFNANIFVAAAAGNLQTGQTDPTGLVNHLGPWLTTVAATTQDEVLSPNLAVTGPGTPPSSITAIPLIPGSTTTSTPTLADAPIATYTTNTTACTASGGIPAGTFTGDIAVLERGTCSFTEKITNAFNAGAVMVVIGNNVAGSINMDTTGAPAIPAYSIDKTPGDALIAFLTTNAVGTANVVPSGIGAVQGDVLASFSYTGPTPSPYQDESKPDISGPGVNIYAATDDQDGNYTLMSGTSMATPHLTGSGALIRAVHTDWTPAEVKSALLSTASNAGGTQVDGVTPWTIDEIGSGRVDLTKAALAGLTLDETYARFLAANPDNGGDIKTLNLPSVRNLACDGTCTWTRTVTNQLATEGSWDAAYTATVGGATVTVSPASFTLAAGATQVLTITATPDSDATVASYGDITLTEANGVAPVQHFTTAVKGSAGTPPTTLCNNGACVLKIDNYTGAGNLNAVGAGAGNYFLWLNRFTPDPADYPFTLTNVQTIFVDALNGGNVGAVVGDTFDVYVYQDDDNDPSNGATLVAAVPGVVVAAPLGDVQTITIPDGVLLNGPGDVLIAFDYHGPGGDSPATADNSAPDTGRSWIGSIHAKINGKSVLGTDDIFVDGFDGTGGGLVGPDLTTEELAPVDQVISGFTFNWIIRGNGTKAGGQPVNLGPQKK